MERSHTPDAETRRLAEDASGENRWKWWGPYVSARQWGTVREDYSENGDAWNDFPFDHARSRAFRWGEDGLAAICDRWQHLCFGVALWNEADPFLKERLFGLTNDEGNHGEDVKEYWWILDGTPTHSWMRWRYKYPQPAFPYDQLREENARRGRDESEYELIDTGVFDDDRYFDVDVTYAKATPEDICVRIDVTNHGPETAPLHVLPTLWFRNTWSWGRDDRRPSLQIAVDPASHGPPGFEAHHTSFGTRYLLCVGEPQLLVCDNESNRPRLWDVEGITDYPKDGINDHVVHGAATVNPDGTGTKAAAWYRFDLAPGATETTRLRLTPHPPHAPALGDEFDEVLRARREEADTFFASRHPDNCSEDLEAIQRQAFASLLWNKKYYRFDVGQWLDGDPASPPPPAGRPLIRNQHWRHLYNADVISMPDEWEYPWYAAWDLAFHMIPMALVDPDFAKEQLILFLREWFMHPNGQLPAYEWQFDDVNPPVHAWACWRVYKIDAVAKGRRDYTFLARAFQKLLINFSWWVNRKDVEGNNMYEGGFLGLDNIGLFDRSKPMPGGAVLEQSDATSWMAMYCLNMLAMALELAHHDRSYEDVATKFFEHFLAIATAASHRAGMDMWDQEDGFFYDILCRDTERIPLKVRSWVGLIPLFAVEVFEPHILDALPDFREPTRWFLRKRPDQSENVYSPESPGEAGRNMLSIVGPRKLRLVLQRMLDETEFLSPHGIRSLSRAHLDHPVRFELGGEIHEVRYSPAESDVDLFGGNSNWRGPVWFPLNFLMIESLQKFHYYLGDEFTVECPTGSGRQANLWDVAAELSRRLTTLFVPGPDGRRPVNGGVDRFDFDPHWREHVTFPEYFDGDTGAGLGATHQTGWTALVAKLIRQSGHLFEG